MYFFQKIRDWGHKQPTNPKFKEQRLPESKGRTPALACQGKTPLNISNKYSSKTLNKLVKACCGIEGEYRVPRQQVQEKFTPTCREKIGKGPEKSSLEDQA